MGKWIELKPDRAESIAAWRADPDSRPRAGIVVVQEIFGVNSHIRAMADRFASVGYLAIAPAVFDRIEKGFDVGYDPDSRTRGMAIVGKLDFEQTLRDVAAAIEVASEAVKVGIVGYCFGGSVVWAAAVRLSGLSAAVGYYGGRILAMKDLTP
ncbi:MAG TPA: dienelactone hydrolase family protein, partial [Roseiarcus sp.]|nr:dienelactone hydrolase family protein [Roseiarcus sp.]